MKIFALLGTMLFVSLLVAFTPRTASACGDRPQLGRYECSIHCGGGVIYLEECVGFGGGCGDLSYEVSCTNTGLRHLGRWGLHKGAVKGSAGQLRPSSGMPAEKGCPAI